ncbi:hypothetical protein, partial [Burkholderia cenocepacia]|uniref:hypothetical protein n=1 Tax=Burkholderia cenocepacia TaxID=95486 RepID=UPI001C0C25B3
DINFINQLRDRLIANNNTMTLGKYEISLDQDENYQAISFYNSTRMRFERRLSRVIFDSAVLKRDRYDTDRDDDLTALVQLIKETA